MQNDKWPFLGYASFCMLTLDMYFLQWDILSVYGIILNFLGCLEIGNWKLEAHILIIVYLFLMKLVFCQEKSWLAN